MCDVRIDMLLTREPVDEIRNILRNIYGITYPGYDHVVDLWEFCLQLIQGWVRRSLRYDNQASIRYNPPSMCTRIRSGCESVISIRPRPSRNPRVQSHVRFPELPRPEDKRSHGWCSEH